MTRKIWKYTVPLQVEPTVLSIPVAWKFLHAEWDTFEDTWAPLRMEFWAEVDDSNFTLEYPFTIHGTGFDLPDHWEWLATLRTKSLYVWHLGMVRPAMTVAEYLAREEAHNSA